ncbi:MAG: Gfo/Idh/MocA family oxidoreductase [Lachnospiraceae bacterium]
MKIGILGAGKMAGKMTENIWAMKQAEIECVAVASRSLEKAEKFAAKYQIEKAYGSYEEMLKEAKIDLVYIATPHSHHYEHIKLCLQYNKNVLCEKAFTVNAKQAEEVTAMAKKKNLLLAEAIWTRYMPSRNIINEVIASGEIGAVHSLQASLGYPISTVERMIRSELAGGALLDLGVYPINFAMMVFGNEVESVNATALMFETGVDAMDSITIKWKNGQMALLHATMLTTTERRGVIQGEDGYLVVSNINNPESVDVYDNLHQKKNHYDIPQQVSGYEYELYACQKAILEKKVECEEMPHTDIIQIMKLMDEMRGQWGMKYKCE